MSAPPEKSYEIELRKAMSQEAGEALKAVLTANGAGVIALLAFFSGKEVGPALRLSLLVPVGVFALGATLGLVAFAARFFVDRFALAVRFEGNQNLGPAQHRSWLIAIWSGVLGGLCFPVAVVLAIIAFAA